MLTPVLLGTLLHPLMYFTTACILPIQQLLAVLKLLLPQITMWWSTRHCA